MQVLQALRRCVPSGPCSCGHDDAEACLAGLNDAWIAAGGDRLLVPTRPDPALCPPRVRASIDAYCELGMPVGDFVRSVLANDLFDAVTRADDVNLPALPHIVAYVVQRVPSALCGSHEKVNWHIASKRGAR